MDQSKWKDVTSQWSCIIWHVMRLDDHVLPHYCDVTTLKLPFSASPAVSHHDTKNSLDCPMSIMHENWRYSFKVSPWILVKQNFKMTWCTYVYNDEQTCTEKSFFAVLLFGWKIHAINGRNILRFFLEVILIKRDRTISLPFTTANQAYWG